MLIGSEEFKHRRTYKIKCPGTYILEEDISFSSKCDKVAISIESDNVILDLNGKTLKQSRKCKAKEVNGIVVKTGHKNVTILGSYGLVKGFTQRGIYVEGGNKNVILENITVADCGYGTEVALFNGTKGLAQSGVQLGDMEFMAAFGMEEFHGVLTNLKVTNLRCYRNNIGLGLGEGSDYSFTGCDISNNYEKRSIWPAFTSDTGFYKPNSAVCYGLVYFSNPDLTPAPNAGIDNTVFENCKFNNNVADGTYHNINAYTEGLIMTVNFKGLKIKNCQFNANESKIGDKGVFSQARGCTLGEGISTVIEDSEFVNNKGGNFTSGFVQSGLTATNSGVIQTSIFQGKSVTLRNCVSSGNTSRPTEASEATQVPPGSVQGVGVVGFVFRYPASATLIDCVAENNLVVLPTRTQGTPNVSAYADGILIYSDRNYPCNFTNNVEIRGAKLSKNRINYDCCSEFNVNVVATSSGVRVYDDLCENIVIRNSVISNNLPGINENPYPIDSEDGCCNLRIPNYISSGIDLFNDTVESVVKTGPSYVSIVDNEIQSNGAYGIYSNLDFNKFEKNRVSYHTVSGVYLDGSEYSSVIDNTFILNDKAVYDNLLVNSSSLIAGNKAFSYPGTAGAYVPANPPPVDSGNLTNFPPVPSFAWSNVDIENDKPIPEYPPQSCNVLARSVKTVKGKGKVDLLQHCQNVRKKLFKL